MERPHDPLMPEQKLVFASPNAIGTLLNKGDRGCGGPLLFDKAEPRRSLIQIGDVKLAGDRFGVDFPIRRKQRGEEGVENLLEQRGRDELQLEAWRFDRSYGDSNFVGPDFAAHV